jgi:hypothetical protein
MVISNMQRAEKGGVMRRTAWVLLIAGVLGGLAGCSKGMDGDYQAYTQMGLGRVAVPLRLKVSGNKAALVSPGQSASFRARVEGDRLILTDDRGGNELAFVRREDGVTLDCSQCAQTGSPDMWVLMTE